MRALRALVVYATRFGGTARVANEIGRALREAGIHADVAPIADVKSLDAYSAVLAGSPMHGDQWERCATRFLRHNRRTLRSRSVWLFHVAALMSVEEESIPLPSDVMTLAKRIGVIGVLTLGGGRSQNGAQSPEVTPAIGTGVTNADSLAQYAAMVAESLRQSNAC